MKRFLAVASFIVVATACSAGGAATLPRADPAAPARIITPNEDVPNPFVLYEDGTYYLYASQQRVFTPNIPLRVGTRLGEWEQVRDAMPVIPSWAVLGFTWAPDVRRFGDRYVMWFTAAVQNGRRDGPRATECIGVAVADSPLGPFVPVGDKPAICQLDRWGSIDPRTFVDDTGDVWLHWKSDDNADVKGTSHSSIYAQRLTADGLHLKGEAVRILEADQRWEGRIVEAPQLVEVDGRYWLFYSGNWFNQPVYGIGVAECDGPAGPCRKPHDGPWLGSNRQGAGPGESSLFQDGHGWWIVYGPWAVVHDDPTPRPVALAHVGFSKDGPYVARLP